MTSRTVDKLCVAGRAEMRLVEDAGFWRIEIWIDGEFENATQSTNEKRAREVWKLNLDAFRKGQDAT